MKINSLKVKFFISLFPMLAITCITISWWFYWSLENNINQQLKEKSENNAKQALYLTEQHIQNTLSDINFIKNNESIGELINTQYYQLNNHAQDKIIKLFLLIKNKKKSIRDFYIIKNNQIISMYNDDPFYLPKSISPLVALENQINIITQNYKKTLLYQFVLPTKDGSHSTLLVTEDFSFLEQIKNTIVHQGYGTLSFTSNLESLENKQTTTMFNTHPDNSINSSLTAMIQQLPLTVKSVVNRDEYETTLEKAKKRAITLSVLFTLGFTLIFILLISRFVINPIKKVSSVAENIANGKSGTALDTKRNDEVGVLLQSISTMSRRLDANKRHVERLAYQDTLTELRNKQFFVNAVKISPTKIDKYYLTVFFIDLQNFKQINSINGFSVANKILKIVGKRIAQFVEHYIQEKHFKNKQIIENVVVARDGADVFSIACYLPQDEYRIKTFIENLHNTIYNSIWIEKVEFSLSARIGWQQLSDNASSKSLLKEAVMALHDAKEKRLDDIRFDPRLITQFLYNQKLTNKINKALEHNEFTLYYQPKKTLRNNNVTEFEALIRWLHPEDGFISPGEFIPFAEKTNLIKDIDYFVLTQVTIDVNRMESMGYKSFVVSFNVSSNRLSDPVFLTLLTNQIKRLKINPNHLQIEITEHSLIENLDKTIDTIKKIKALGLSISLDDFGTGTSSLEYLKDLPIDVIKIDRCFVKNISQSKSDAIILKGIIMLGRALNLQTIAEGVETEEEYLMIDKFGCDAIQGFYFYRPMCFDDAIKQYYCSSNTQKDKTSNVINLA